MFLCSPRSCTIVWRTRPCTSCVGSISHLGYVDVVEDSRLCSRLITPHQRWCSAEKKRRWNFIAVLALIYSFRKYPAALLIKCLA
jgi:hypothetical protein